MKKLLFATLLTLSATVFSQNANIGDYELIFQDDLVEVSLAEGVFKENSRSISHSRYFIQYKNLMNEEVEVTILKELHYGDRCYGCDGNEENYKKIIIPANTTLSFNQDNTDKRFYFFVKDNNGLIKSQLTHFEIKIIQTK